jgi:cell wall-associated NlpC family hydrolase
MSARAGGSTLGRGAVLAIISVVSLLVLALIMMPMAIFAGGSLSLESGGACSANHGGQGNQPPSSPHAKNSIPANYLRLFKSIGTKTGVPWVVLAGIGEVESDDGRTKLPGVHSGSNAFGAAGPMQIGIGGASTNTWGGKPIHPASQKVAGVASDGDGDGIDNVYDPADAIAGAAKYLLEHGVLNNVQGAIFAYNHLASYVAAVMSFASSYARGGFTVSPVTLDSAPGCAPTVPKTPNSVVARIIAFAQQQIGKPYQWGGTGPDSFDCSGLVMMAYRSAGIDIPRVANDQYFWGPHIKASQAEPGDLVFFAGADGTQTHPGHVGLVIGGGKMIEAYATGFPIRVATYTGRSPIGFTRPWAHKGVSLPAVTALAG